MPTHDSVVRPALEAQVSESSGPAEPESEAAAPNVKRIARMIVMTRHADDADGMPAQLMVSDDVNVLRVLGESSERALPAGQFIRIEALKSSR